MPNNQAHDPRVANAQDRVAQAVGLQVAAVSGGISGLTVTALDGTMAHGNRVRIEADSSYAIGPKAQAAPKHWQMGQEIFMEGSAVASEPLDGGANVTDVWSDTGGFVSVKDSYVRHSFVDRSYLMVGAGQLKTSQPFVGITPEAGKKYYQSFRVYPGERYRFLRIYTIANITGSFNLDPDRKRGELVDIVSGAETGTAYITWISGGYVTFEGVSGATHDGLAGGTITGQESGATADLVSYVASPWSVKAFRVEQESEASQGHRWTYSYLSRGWIFHGVRDATGTQVYTNGGGEYLNENSDPANNPLQWSLFEFILDYSGDTGDEWIYFNGKLVHETHNIDLSLVSTVTGNRPALIGMDTPGTDAPNSDVGLMMAIGEFYIDNDTRRLYVCDASTFATSTDIELVRPEAWTENPDGSVVIDAYLYQGAFADMTGKYLALVDGSTVIFEGVAI